ncbi:MAG: hypothetical protein HY053_04595 [Proteobacteria bacterium]|nr:hypothetical protein [Pseudomonadota bacterium]
MSEYTIIKDKRGRTIEMKPATEAFYFKEALQGTGINPKTFRAGLPGYFRNATLDRLPLMQERVDHQAKISAYHRERRLSGKGHDPADYAKFLKNKLKWKIGALPDYQITTKNIDKQFSIPAPQPVTPLREPGMVMNYMEGAWIKREDALSITDVILSDLQGRTPYQAAFDRLIEFYNRDIKLKVGDWKNLQSLAEVGGKLEVTLTDGTKTELQDPAQYRGRGADNDKVFLFEHNGLGREMRFDGEISPLLGLAGNAAKITSFQEQCNITGLIDKEDATECVNEAGELDMNRREQQLYRGTYTYQRAGQAVARRMPHDRVYRGPDGKLFSEPGRPVLMSRVRGLAMETDSIRVNGMSVPEFAHDLLASTLAIKADLMKPKDSPLRNSQTGSGYITFPKCWGYKEARYARQMKDAAEDLAGLPRNTLKFKFMNESFRSSVEFDAILYELRDCVSMENTGIYDRWGDDIHTNGEIGPVLPEDDAKKGIWYTAYEERARTTAIRRGFLKAGAQIGMGMWAFTKRLQAGLANKETHFGSGATTTWVASLMAGGVLVEPCHNNDVRAIQAGLDRDVNGMSKRAYANWEWESLLRMLTFPVAPEGYFTTTTAVKAKALKYNTNGLLGYFAPWNEGRGCSAIPDADGNDRMEDAATGLCKAEETANGLLHDVYTEEEVLADMKARVPVIDANNIKKYPGYVPMAGNEEHSLPFQAVREAIFERTSERVIQPALYKMRRKRLAQLAAQAA